MFPAISNSLAKSIPHDLAAVSLWDESEQAFRGYALGPGANWELMYDGPKTFSDESLTAQILAGGKGEGRIIRRAEMEIYAVRFEKARQALDSGLVSWCVVPPTRRWPSGSARRAKLSLVC